MALLRDVCSVWVCKRTNLSTKAVVSWNGSEKFFVTQICMQIKQENPADQRWEQKIVFLPLQITKEVPFHKKYPAFYCAYLHL